jgi:hypothetical protein
MRERCFPTNKEIHRRSCTLRYRRPHQDGPLERPFMAPKGQSRKAVISQAKGQSN